MAKKRRTSNVSKAPKKKVEPEEEIAAAAATATEKQPKQEEKEQKILLAEDDSSSEEEMDEETEQPNDKDDGSDDEKEDTDADAASASTEEEDEVIPPIEVKPEPAFKSDGRYHNKQRCLILASRGVTSRFRHLLEDLRTLIPHHKKDSKLDASKNDVGGIGAAVNDIAEMRGCNSVLFLECRKRKDAYLWLSHTNSNGSNGNGNTHGHGYGPSAKFLVENIHTMDELRLTGNCMKGSRPLLTFDTSFEEREELKLLKCLLTDVFGTPRGHPKSKPFVDRVMGFYHADGKVCTVYCII